MAVSSLITMLGFEHERMPEAVNPHIPTISTSEFFKKRSIRGPRFFVFPCDLLPDKTPSNKHGNWKWSWIEYQWQVTQRYLSTACSFYTLFMSTLGPLAVKSQLAACSTSWCNKWSGLREITITLQLSTSNLEVQGDRFVMKICGSFWVLVEEVHGVVTRLHDANDLIVPRKTMENLHDFPIQHTHLRLCRFLIILGATATNGYEWLDRCVFSRETEHL